MVALMRSHSCCCFRLLTASTVKALKEQRVLQSEAIERAMLAIPRGLFVTDDLKDEAYIDQPSAFSSLPLLSSAPISLVVFASDIVASSSSQPGIQHLVRSLLLDRTQTAKRSHIAWRLMRAGLRTCTRCVWRSCASSRASRFSTSAVVVDCSPPCVLPFAFVRDFAPLFSFAFPERRLKFCRSPGISSDRYARPSRIFILPVVAPNVE